MSREIRAAGKIEKGGRGRQMAHLFRFFVLLVRLHHSGAVCFNIEVPALQHLHARASQFGPGCSMVLPANTCVEHALSPSTTTVYGQSIRRHTDDLAQGWSCTVWFSSDVITKTSFCTDPA